jgi:SGNH domain (fused to AT3 domains)
VGVRASFDKHVPDFVVEVGNVADSNGLLRRHLLPKRKEFDRAFRSAIEDVGGIYISVLRDQCGVNCNATTDTGDLIYFDNSHLTRAGADILTRSIASQIGGQFRADY